MMHVVVPCAYNLPAASVIIHSFHIRPLGLFSTQRFETDRSLFKYT